MATQCLADGRQLLVFGDEAQMAQRLVTEVTAAAKEKIAAKGSDWDVKDGDGKMGGRWQQSYTHTYIYIYMYIYGDMG